MIDLGVMKQWLTGNKEDLAAVGTISGIIAGPLITLIKEAIGFFNDRSWEKKTDKNVALIGQSLRDLHDAQQYGVLQNGDILKPFYKTLEERIQQAAGELEQQRQRLVRQMNARLEEPTGVRRWFLLFRPHGFSGWVVHATFYAFAVTITTGLVFFLHVNIDNMRMHQGNFFDVLFGVVFFVIYGAFALLPRAVSLKQRRCWIACRGREDPNSDLAWWRKLILAFAINKTGAWIERVFCFFCAFAAVYTPYLSVTQSPMNASAPDTLGRLLLISLDSLFFLWLAWLLWYDVLLGRALDRCRS
jgi:hypothetical protein